MSTVALIGGNEFRPNCETMDRELLHLLQVNRPIKVVILPTAATERPDLAAANGVRYFSRLGAEARAADIIDRASAVDPTWIGLLHDADIAYLCGGDPWYLLETLRDTPALQALRTLLADGRIVAGSSAGAMVLGQQMASRGWTNWIEGLSLAPGVAVIPHHQRSDDPRARRLRAVLGAGVTMLGVPEATACICELTRWQALGIGPVTLYHETGSRELPAGASLQIADR